MRRPRLSRQLWLGWRNRRQVAEEVDAELAFHLERKTEALIAEGLAPEEARREALHQFGNLDLTRRYCREQDELRERTNRRMTMLDELKYDLTYAIRPLRSAPGFALVALLTLALGIGANTAIFSVVRGVLLRPLPIPNADRVLRVWHANPEGGVTRSQISEPDLREWQAATTRFSSLSGYWYAPGASGADLLGEGAPERIEGAYFTPTFFETLQVPAQIGRTIKPEEAVVGNDRYVVISDGLWQRRFDRSPQVIGRGLAIDGESFTVLGVMPPGFAYPASDRIDFWIPLSTIPEDGIGRSRWSRFLDVVGRLAPGATPEQARAELATFSRETAARDEVARGWTDVTLATIRDALFGEVRRPLMVLAGAVAFVLLITCVNIASLLLARATVRQRELALRAALGAGRHRIMRQLLIESLVLSLLGGALGVGLAFAAMGAFRRFGSAELPRASAVAIDAPVLLFAFGISIAAGLLFGLLPAIRATSSNLEGMLRGGARGMVGAPGQRLRSILVVTEVALATILATGAGLATKSVSRLLAVDPGFDPNHLLAMRLSIPSSRYSDEKAVRYYESLLAAIAAVPGVEGVGSAKVFPLRGTGEQRDGLLLPPGPGGERKIRLPILHVSADYFRVMRIPVLRGRGFTQADREGTPFVWVVNQAFERRYFPGETAVGKVLRLGDLSIPIIGVVGDVRQRSLAEPAEPQGYVHYLQNHRSGMSLVIRTTGDPLALVGPVRQAIWSVDRDQTIVSVETMASIMGGAMARPQLLASLLLLFGTMGLTLGALGIYGVLAYQVNQRRQEIGVRMTLGASPQSVMQLVVGRGMLLALVGVAVGVAGSLLLTRVMNAILYEVRPTDPPTFIVVMGVLLGSALVASWLPARRALRIDPVQALRYD